MNCRKKSFCKKVRKIKSLSEKGKLVQCLKLDIFENLQGNIVKNYK